MSPTQALMNLKLFTTLALLFTLCMAGSAYAYGFQFLAYDSYGNPMGVYYDLQSCQRAVAPIGGFCVVERQ